MDKSLDKILGLTQAVNGCWIWQRALNSDGYARAVIDGNANAKVHRVVFELLYGYLPPVVRHTCDNPACIKPDHLIAGTCIENVADRKARGRSHNHVHQELIDKVFHLRKVGLTYVEIADTLAIKAKRVEYIMNKYVKLHM